ncbi:MAG TPA: HNH endonuclease [Ktedonobacterales bacterium]
MSAPSQQPHQPARRGAAQRPARPSRAASAPSDGARRYTVSTPTVAQTASPAHTQRRPARHLSPATSGDARPVQPAARQRAHVRSQRVQRSGVSLFPANLDWPERFDDWMIDIMRRRALRLNSGARRRGAPGSVRAVELAHIMERSTDDKGRWICAICHQPMTLVDLSFDHIVALADGGEHAAHNLAPTHRKCNEIKGSEKAQYRVQARDRWLTEWASGSSSIGSSEATNLSALPARSAQSRYA